MKLAIVQYNPQPDFFPSSFSLLIKKKFEAIKIMLIIINVIFHVQVPLHISPKRWTKTFRILTKLYLKSSRKKSTNNLGAQEKVSTMIFWVFSHIMWKSLLLLISNITWYMQWGATGHTLWNEPNGLCVFLRYIRKHSWFQATDHHVEANCF